MTDQKYLCPFKTLEIIYMMATRTISQEANNYVRLDFAVKGTCTECLRDVLLNCVPVGFQDINHAIQFLEPGLKHHLESYKYSQLFTNHQLRPDFSVSECDMSLVYSLIRNSNWVPPPTQGWGKSFTNNPQDISLGANVERLHLFRNILEHCKEPSISNQDFNNYWTEVRKCVADIETSLGSTRHQQSLDRLRGGDLDPEYANRIINKFNDVVKGLQAEQYRHCDCLLEIRKDQSVQGSTLSDITNSLNEQSKELSDLKIEESNQSKLLCEVAGKNEQQYQLLENDRRVLSDIKKSQDHQDVRICEVLHALRDEDNGLVGIAKEQNNQMQHLSKKLEEMHENQMLLLNNNNESFKKIQEIMERRANEEARYTDSTDIRNQHQNEADDKTATTDALDCNVNREKEISIAEGPDGRICLIKQYVFLKSNLSKTKAKAIADCLLKERLITSDEHETIADLNLPRRLRIDHLLKKIILGDSDQLKTFFKALNSVDLTVARTLATTDVTDQERSRFRQLEERALQVTNASGRSDSKCNLDSSDICFFQYHLSAFDEDIDSINDAMLSRFNFSVRDHSNVLHAKTPDEKIEKLCQTMNLCAINIENELNTLLKASLYNKWMKLRTKRGNQDRQQFLQWLNAPVTLVSYVFGCSRLRFNHAETGSIILKFSIQDGFNMASLTRGSLQENITDLLWKGYMETQISMINPVHVTVFIMSPRENGQDEIHLYLDFDKTDDTRSREDYEHDIAIQERKLLLEELDPTELTEWITNQLDVEKNAIHMLEDKLSGSVLRGKKEMLVLLNSIYELENGRDLIKQFCKQNKHYRYGEQHLTADRHSIVMRESLTVKPLIYECGPVYQRQRYPFQMDIKSGISSGSSVISSQSSVISSWSSDIPQSYSVHGARIAADSGISSPSLGIPSWSSDILHSYSIHKARQTADSEHEFGIQERNLLLEELDPTELTEWITSQLDVQKTKIHIFEDKLSRSDMYGKEEMTVLLDSLYELENGRDLIERFCKQNDPYVYRKLFLTTDQNSTEKHESPIEKPLQYKRGGGLQRLYSFWIDISTDQKGMKNSEETDELLRTIVDKREPVDENAAKKPQNLEVSQPGISTWCSQSSEFNPGYNIKTENKFMEPIVWKCGDMAIVLQVGKLDEIWSDAMVIVGKGRSSPDLPRPIIEKVGPQIQREFQDKYPNGIGAMEVAVLSGFNLPVWKIFYCEYSLNEIETCLEMADKLKMRSILFLVQDELFTVNLGVQLSELNVYLKYTSSISTIYFYVDQDTLEWRKLRKIAEDELLTTRVYFSHFSTDGTKLSANPEPKAFNVGHVTVIIQVGKLEEIKSDALVIFEVAKEQWPTQNLPSEILEKTDPMIQKEFKEKFPAGLEYAEVAVLNGYNLPCRKILYGVLPRWPVAWLKQVITVFLTECFQLASDEGITSIAFMILSVPYHVAEMYASVLHSCFEMRIYEKPSLSISMQNIVIKDGCTGANMLKKVFEEEWARRIVFKEGHIIVVIQERVLEEILMRRGKGTQTCAALSKEPQENAIIPDSKALVIVSESEDITAILEEISPSLEVEFRTKYPYALPKKKVAILDGYNNPFKKIYCSNYRSKAEVTDIILECLQMAENDKMNSIFLWSNPIWTMISERLAQELILGLRIFVIENPSSSIRRLYSDSEILRQEISDVTSVKVFKERHVTVVLNATYNEHEYILGVHGIYSETPANKLNSVHVICGVTDEGQPKGRLHEYLEDMTMQDLKQNRFLVHSLQRQKEGMIHFQKGFTSGDVSILGYCFSDTMRVFFGPPKLDRQDMDMFFYKCIQKADESGVHSVTFLVPNIVRSIKLFASTLITCVKRFARKKPSSSIKRIYIRINEYNPEFQETKRVYEEEWTMISGEENPEVLSQQIDETQEKQGGKQRYPSKDIYLKKTLTYSKLPEKSKEGSTYVPQKEVD